MSTMSALSIATAVPRPHRDPDVRLDQRGRVVHAVADHRHRATTGLEPTDALQLLLREQLRLDLVDPDLASHAITDRRGVSRKVPACAPWSGEIRETQDPANRSGISPLDVPGGPAEPAQLQF